MNYIRENKQILWRKYKASHHFIPFDQVLFWYKFLIFDLVSAVKSKRPMTSKRAFRNAQNESWSSLTHCHVGFTRFASDKNFYLCSLKCPEGKIESFYKFVCLFVLVCVYSKMHLTEFAILIFRCTFQWHWVHSQYTAIMTTIHILFPLSQRKLCTHSIIISHSPSS